MKKPNAKAKIKVLLIVLCIGIDKIKSLLILVFCFVDWKKCDLFFTFTD